MAIKPSTINLLFHDPGFCNCKLLQHGLNAFSVPGIFCKPKRNRQWRHFIFVSVDLAAEHKRKKLNSEAKCGNLLALSDHQ